MIFSPPTNYFSGFRLLEQLRTVIISVPPALLELIIDVVVFWLSKDLLLKFPSPIFLLFIFTLYNMALRGEGIDTLF